MFQPVHTQHCNTQDHYVRYTAEGVNCVSCESKDVSGVLRAAAAWHAYNKLTHCSALIKTASFILDLSFRQICICSVYFICLWLHVVGRWLCLHLQYNAVVVFLFAFIVALNTSFFCSFYD